MDHQIPQASIEEGDRKPGQGSDTHDLREPDVEIVKGNISREHVHLLVSVPPTLAVSRLVQRMKGLTLRKLLQENRGLNKAFWGRHLLGRGYYVTSTGNVTEEMISRYIENQQEMERTQDAEFTVEP